MIDLPAKDLKSYKSLEALAEDYVRWLGRDDLPLGTMIHYYVNLVDVQQKMIEILSTARGSSMNGNG